MNITNSLLLQISSLTNFCPEFIHFFLDEDGQKTAIPKHIDVAQTKDDLMYSINKGRGYDIAKCLYVHCRAVEIELESNEGEVDFLKNLYKNTHNKIPQKKRVARVLSYCDGKQPKPKPSSPFSNSRNFRESFLGILGNLSYSNGDAYDLIRFLSKHVKRHFNFDPNILKIFFEVVKEVVESEQKSK